MGDVSQKLLQKIFVPIQYLELNLFRILFEGTQPFLIFLIGMNVRVEEVADNLFSFSPELFQWIDGAVSTADMK